MKLQKISPSKLHSLFTEYLVMGINLASGEHNFTNQTECDPLFMTVGQEATQVTGELALLDMPQ